MAMTSEKGYTNYSTTLGGSLGFVAAMVRDFSGNIPRLLRLRKRYQLAAKSHSEPRVCLVCDNLDGTHGISVSSIRLVGDLRRRGKTIHLLGIAHTRNAPGPRAEDGSVLMLPPYSVQEMFGYRGQELAVPRLSDLLDFLERNPVDIVELETPAMFSLLALIVARILGIAVVSNYRTDLLSYTQMLLDSRTFKLFLAWYLKMFYQQGGDVIVPSRAFEERVIDMDIPASRIALLPRSVDLGRFHPERRSADAWAELGAPPGPVVCYLGRVSREKGLEVLAEAFERILETHPDAVLGVIGEGPYREEFQARVGSRGRAVFAGEVVGDNLPRLLASSAILAFPSTTDTFGNAVLEALACGVPAVVTDQGGPCEIVEDGQSGIVFPGGDARAMTSALRRLLDDAATYGAMSRAARVRAEKFSGDIALDRLWGFYLRVCQRHSNGLAADG